MTSLNDLKSASTLSHFSHLLGYKPKDLSYILYKIEEDKKYKTFSILKKNGGEREIKAPIKKLKTLQRKLSDLLYSCIEETQKNNKSKNPSSKKNNVPIRDRKCISHGFKKGFSIASNAEIHKGKRHVLNLDLSNFFPSINFGRVRGYFIKNKTFKLNPKIATIIAQIACHKNELPQGSPCSPIISNLVTEILDVRMVRLAKKYNCTYSRYADDLTFSTNLKDFPTPLARKNRKSKSNWVIGTVLSKSIEDAGYNINHSKTRMQYKESRQVVTGLVVNKIVNVKSEYYRYARSMCHSLFMTGSFTLPKLKKNKIKPNNFWEKVCLYFNKDFLNRDKKIDNIKEPLNVENDESTSLNQLEGILSYIFQIKKYRNKFSVENNERTIEGIKKLYSKFLFFKKFYFLERPLIWCEGKTDKIYLKCALQQLCKNYPQLINSTDEKRKFNIDFLNHTETFSNVMDLAPGTSGMRYLISKYDRLMEQYKCAGKRHPVIILIDNDDGAKEILSLATEIIFSCKDIDGTKKKKRKKEKLKIDGSKEYYHLVKNLYLIVIPKINNKSTQIEDFFSKKIRDTILDGKTFNPENTPSGETNEYGKLVFAERVILPNQSKINFDPFKKILTPISEAIAHYKNDPPAAI